MEQVMDDDENNYFLGVKELPNKHKGGLIRYIEKHSIFNLILKGFLIYSTIVLSFTLIFYLLILLNHEVINKNVGFVDLLYFNFISILTIGYGDYEPLGFGRFLAVLEALIGLGLFGAWIGIVILKITLPSKDSIVFSKYCYYVKGEESFVIIFLNTNHLPLVNADMCSFLKKGRDFIVKSSFKSPYIGKSAWTFSVYKLPIAQIRKLRLYPDDGLKFGIDGSYGFTKFATAIKYPLKDILVISNRDHLTNDTNLRDPKLSSPELQNSFHYKPEGAHNFLEYAKNLGAIIES